MRIRFIGILLNVQGSDIQYIHYNLFSSEITFFLLWHVDSYEQKKIL